MHVMTADRQRRLFEGLQALRFLAALLVVITHSTFYTHERLDSTLEVWRIGAIGVDVFFIISGFVMMATSVNLVYSENGWRQFIRKRLLRIVPMYWLATSLKIGLMLVIPSMILHAELSPWRIFASYTFLPTTNPDGRFEPLVGVGWTLIFEMFFYAMFALGLFLRVSVARFVSVLLLSCATIGFFREADWPAATMYFDPIVIYFSIGMSFFYLVRNFSPSVLASASGIIFTLALAAALTQGIPVRGAGNSFIGFLLASSGVLFVLSIEPFIAGKVPRFILFFGEASYVLYLFHPFAAPVIPELIKRVGPGWVSPWMSVLMSILVALVAAAVIHIWVEKPATKWLNTKFGEKPRRAHASA